MPTGAGPLTPPCRAAMLLAMQPVVVRCRRMLARSTDALRVLVALLALGLACAQGAHANGWEHWGIPLDVLLNLLADEDPGYRIRAARSLGVRAEKSALEPMLALLRRPEEPAAVKEALLVALGGIGGPLAREALIANLTRESRDELRAAAARALGKAGVGSADAQRALMKATGAGEPLLMRAAAVEALGNFPSDTVVQRLSEIARSASSDTLQARAIQALGATRNRAATRTLLRLLETARSDRRRALVIDAMARVADPAARPALLELIETAQHPGLKVRATVALASLSGNAAAPALVPLLAHPIATIRYVATEALTERGDARAAPALRELYRRETRVAKQLRADALAGRPGDYLAAQSLRLAALRALIELDAPGSAPVFADALREPLAARESAVALRVNEGLHELRRSALVGLGYARSAPALDSLLTSGFLDSDDFRLRATAVRALGIGGWSAAAPAVAARLVDEVAEVRWTAALVLGRLRSRAALTGLRAALGDPHPEVRRQSALALGFLADEGALAKLRSLVRNDADREVRMAAQASVNLLDRSGEPATTTE